MKIIILGAGQVGTTVAYNLSNEANDITVVDQDNGLLRELQDWLEAQADITVSAFDLVSLSGTFAFSKGTGGTFTRPGRVGTRHGFGDSEWRPSSRCGPA